jgi:polysaccharide pyruvyl transferase WcaK-like protein
MELIDKVATFTSLVFKEGYSVRLFGSDLKADPAAIEDLRKTLLDRHRISVSKYVPIDSVDELLSEMSEMDYVVTCRFHGVVFAHLLNKPILAIAHHPKVTHLTNALGLSKYCVDMTMLIRLSCSINSSR